jgi:hypothetical protein
MSQFGIPTVTQPAAPTPEVDRFKSPRPVFVPPKNAEHILPKVKDNSPAPSLASQATTTSNDVVKAALLAASQAGKTTIPDSTGKAPRQQKARVEKAEQPKVNTAPQFGPKDVCDERTFIVRTRSGDYHTPEMKRLFWANGGERHMVGSLTYAQAFSNLRTEKLRSIRK